MRLTMSEHDPQRQVNPELRYLKIWQSAFEMLTSETAESRPPLEITFQDVVNEQPKGWIAYFLGEIRNLGRDDRGLWFDIKLSEHQRSPDTMWRLMGDLLGEVRNQFPADINDWTPEMKRRFEAMRMGALAMQDEMMQITGETQNLEVPEDVQRFYMDQLGDNPYLRFAD